MTLGIVYITLFILRLLDCLILIDCDTRGGFERGKIDMVMIDKQRRFDHDQYPPTSAGPVVFQPTAARQIYCYSCMSKPVQDYWDHVFWKFFRRPEVFTESCDPDHIHRGVVKLRNCTDHCIWLIFETQVMGKRFPVYTRGCMSDLLNYRQDAVKKLRSGELCVRRQLSELYNDGDRKFPINDLATLCACHSNYCNSADWKFEPNWITVGVALQVLIASGFWRCWA